MSRFWDVATFVAFRATYMVSANINEIQIMEEFLADLKTHVGLKLLMGNVYKFLPQAGEGGIPTFPSG